MPSVQQQFNVLRTIGGIVKYSDPDRVFFLVQRLRVHCSQRSRFSRIVPDSNLHQSGGHFELKDTQQANAMRLFSSNPKDA